jgi:hypothetical protein
VGNAVIFPQGHKYDDLTGATVGILYSTRSAETSSLRKLLIGKGNLPMEIIGTGIASYKFTKIN